MKNDNTYSTPGLLVFRQDWFEALDEMSARVRLQVYEAVMNYQYAGTVPEEMNKEARLAFHFIRKELDGELATGTAVLPAVQAAPVQPPEPVNPDPEPSAPQEPEAQAGEEEAPEPEEEEPEDPYERMFAEFRGAYPGPKGVLADEFKNFKNMNPADWKDVLPELLPAVQRMKAWREKLRGTSTPPRPVFHIRCWINLQAWKDYYPGFPEYFAVHEGGITYNYREYTSDFVPKRPMCARLFHLNYKKA